MTRASDDVREEGEIGMFRNGAKLPMYLTSISSRLKDGAVLPETS